MERYFTKTKNRLKDAKTHFDKFSHSRSQQEMANIACLKSIRDFFAKLPGLTKKLNPGYRCMKKDGAGLRQSAVNSIFFQLTSV
ncbi:hypothetical protein [Desulfobacter sp.]|uniref:hypothetical protein n=1 Tax=Desulfobacter sp. TaxID=2294 RepID=UPI003D125B7D